MFPQPELAACTPSIAHALKEHGPIVEIGAGGGMWATALRAVGIDVMAFDNRGLPGAHHELAAAMASEEHALLAVWPPDGAVIQDWIKARPWPRLIIVANWARLELGDALAGYEQVFHLDLPPGRKGRSQLRVYRRLPHSTQELAEMTFTAQDRALLHTIARQQAHILKRLHTIMDNTAQTNAEIADLRDDVSQESTVIASAVTLMSGLSQQLADALSAAQSAGATPEQLQAINEVHQALVANRTQLAQAVAANTPAQDSGSTPPSGDTTTPPASSGSDQTGDGSGSQTSDGAGGTETPPAGSDGGPVDAGASGSTDTPPADAPASDPSA